MKIYIISWTVQKWFSEKVCLDMKRKKGQAQTWKKLWRKYPKN